MNQQQKIDAARSIYYSMRDCKRAGCDYVTWRRMTFPEMPAWARRSFRGIWRSLWA